MTAYVTDDEFREWADVQGHVEASQMPGLDLVLSAASKAIDSHCGRTFGAAGTSEARIFDGGTCKVYLDDFATVTLVEESSDRTTWSTVSTYWTGPNNTTPKYWIEGNYRFARWVRVTGTYGYGSTPDEVKLSTLMKSAKLWKRKATPTGVEGFGDFGVVRISTREDADIIGLLADLVRVDGMIA